MNCSVRTWWGATLLATSLGVAQTDATLPPPTAYRIATAGRADALPYVVQLPPAFAADRPWPLLVLLPEGDGEAAAKAAIDDLGRTIAAGGFVVVAPAVAASDSQLPEFFAQLRQSYRIAQGGMHAAGGGGAVGAAVRVVQRNAHEFQTLTLWGAAAPQEAAAVSRLRERRLRVLKTPTAVELRDHLIALHGERTVPGAAGLVDRALDDFHDAATKGDEARYFGLLPDDAVFLGTDATERWTGEQFRKFAMPWFERGPAWTYVPLRRQVTLGPGEALAWFDEVLDNIAYGECRGTGVMELRDGRWVVRQYNLTIPVPNDLAKSVVERIRALAAGRAPAVTTIVVVRHAEKKGEGDDPELTEGGIVRSLRLAETLAGLDVAAVYTTEFRRTAATAVPLCRARNLQPAIVPAADIAALAARLRRDHPGRTSVVVGHSNTVPAVLKALGVADAVEVGDAEYDRLFVVTLSAGEARLLSLRYGSP